MLRKIEQTDKYLKLRDKYGIYMIMPVSDSIIRCVYTVLDDVKESSELIIPQESTLKKCVWSEEAAGWRLLTDELDVFINSADGYISYKDRAGKILLCEAGREAEKKAIIHYTTNGEPPVIERVKTIDGERNFVKNLQKVEAGTASKAKIHFDFAEDERIYGLGQAEEGISDYRYEDQYLYQHNMRIPMPFFLSSRGYGMLTDCGSVMTWHGGKEDSYLFLDTVYQADTYFIAGENADDIIAKLRRLTGKAVMLPRWAFGYIQSKEMYHSAKELLDVVKEYPVITKVTLFGSRASGNNREDSDIDLLILVDGQKLSPEREAAIKRQLYEVELQTGVIISSIVMPRALWENRPFQPPFSINIKNEGVRL